MHTCTKIHLLSVAALAVIGCKQSREVSRQNASAPETSGTKRPETALTIPLGSFAFVDSSGTQLLALSPLADPSQIRGAVCYGGLVLPVRYDRKQTPQLGDNPRRIVSNFSREAGAVFRPARGQAQPNGTCYLSADSALLARAVNVTPLDTLPCLPDQSSRLAAAKRRPIVHCWRIARTPTAADVVAVQFATVDSNALASLIVVRDTSFLFQDFPAVYRGPEESVWRVDDGGIFSPQTFEILFVAELSGTYVMAITWAAGEGESDILVVADSTNVFRTVVEGYRYTSQ